MKIEPDIRFYDTCSLLIGGEDIFDKREKFLISSVTLQELERIKTSSTQDIETKFSARLVLRLLDTHKVLYEVIKHDRDNEQLIDFYPVTDDLRILIDAAEANNSKEYRDRVIFVTNDLALKNFANLYFGDGMIESIDIEKDEYTGYKDIIATNEQLEEFYSGDNGRNIFECCIGQYLILRDSTGEIKDVRCWDGQEYRYIDIKPFTSVWFGTMTPTNNDVYQKLLFDSLIHNKITMVRGPAGSGKTQISLGFLMNQLDKGRIDKIVIFCNTVATMHSARLGLDG